jgi:chromosome segregation ATPase
LGSEDYRVCQCKSAIKRTTPGDNNRCLECGQIFKRGINRENIKEACFDCGRPSEVRTGHTVVGRNSVQGDGHFRCGECNARYIKYLQEKAAKEDEKNQQITNLQGQLNQKEEQLTKSSQQLETERQAKKEVERSLEESKTQQEQVQNELTQLREELVKVRQELTQAQEKLKEQMEKSPQTNTEQLIEKLGKSGKNLTASQKLVQNPKLNHQDIIEVKNQLDNSRRIIAAAAAHTQSVERTMPLQLREQVKPTKINEQPNKINYFPYLISGFVISGLLVLGLLF